MVKFLITPALLYFTLSFAVSVSFLNLSSATPAVKVYNVFKFGARGNGATDSTQAFSGAWAAACASEEPAVIYLPRGRYLLGSVTFNGFYCKSPSVTFLINGTLVAPSDYRVLGKSENWVSFEHVRGVSIIGGALDGKGTSLWACKASGTGVCPEGATNLRFTNSNNIKIKGLLSLNSQLYHIVINRCTDVGVEGVKIIAASDSPNTDGVHVQQSTNVVIKRSSIKTGDDCVSIGHGTRNLWIESVTCGPGHGISIGSLGKESGEEGVQNVTVWKSVFTGTTNGLRIKSWARPSSAFVKRVRFIDAVMQNVDHPIIIDQHYCPNNLNCPHEVSGVKISDVIYWDIRGTSATPVAVKFDCSSKYPCEGIRLHKINLRHLTLVAQASCTNAIGKAVGLVQPEGCL